MDSPDKASLASEHLCLKTRVRVGVLVNVYYLVDNLSFKTLAYDFLHQLDFRFHSSYELLLCQGFRWEDKFSAVHASNCKISANCTNSY